MSNLNQNDVEKGANAYRRGLMNGEFSLALTEKGGDWDRAVSSAVLSAVLPSRDKRIRIEVIKDIATQLERMDSSFALEFASTLRAQARGL